MAVSCVLQGHQVEAVARRGKQAECIRYSGEVPRERVQLDITKYGMELAAFTAADGGTRLKSIRNLSK